MTQEQESPEIDKHGRAQTYYAVDCPTHGFVYLTAEEYDRQMSRPDSLWLCPICLETAYWNDDNYERSFEDPNYRPFEED